MVWLSVSSLLGGIRIRAEEGRGVFLGGVQSVQTLPHQTRRIQKWDARVVGVQQAGVRMTSRWGAAVPMVGTCRQRVRLDARVAAVLGTAVRMLEGWVLQ